MQWLGYLRREDPMYTWLTKDVFPTIELFHFNEEIKVHKLSASNQVYLYEANHDGRIFNVVGKFYGSDSVPNDKKRNTLRRELDNIQRLYSYGFYDGPYRIAKCLGYNEYINYVLATEYVKGPLLDHHIKEAALRNNVSALYYALSELAHFLFLLHSRSMRTQSGVDFNRECSYFHETLSRLNGLVPHEDLASLQGLGERWRNNPRMWSAPLVIVHGDCTPTNFIFPDNPRVVAVDVERSRWSDPTFDTGRIAGELKHHFIMRTGDGLKAEPFIEHFYKAYCSYFEDPNQVFKEVTRRNPFYQALTELRIAKNYWIFAEHRRRLVEEAKMCLRY